MTYPEPSSSLTDLIVDKATSTTQAVIRSKNNLLIEVQFLSNFGWSIELRYDLLNAQNRRQILTGAQDSFELLPLEVASSDLSINISLKTISEEIRFIKETGQFVIIVRGKEIFKSTQQPFSWHENAAEIYEGLMSLKVTDFSERAPFAPKGEKFKTQMIRFQYNRPEGLVLGLPGQTGEINRNGYRFELYNTDEFLHTPLRKPLYQSWPVLFHRALTDDSWIGIFHDNPSRTFVDVGDFYNDKVTFEALAGNTRIYIASANSLTEISTRFSKLLGGATFPPLWAFGYQQCRWSYMNETDIRSVIQSLRSNSIPFDAIYFDIDYMEDFKPFTVNKCSFPEMSQLLRDLHDDGIMAVNILDPGIKVDEKYSVYNKIRETGKFLKAENGEDFIGKAWPGKVSYPDFGDQMMQDLWKVFHGDWLAKFPFDGIWNDMNEPSNFDGANRSTCKALTARGPLKDEYNLYGLYSSDASAAAWTKIFPKRRGLNITRAGYPGVQKNSVIWHGDNMAWWEHLRLAIDTCIQYSLAGAIYTGPDVPGFTGNPSDDLAIRFFQLGAFLPLFRGHSIFYARDKEPYAYSKQASELIRGAICLRYSLLREWYSSYECAWRERKPLMSPVLIEDKTLARDQFLLFGKLLCAPVIERDQVKKLVYLPEGPWYALSDTTKIYDGEQWLSLDVTLESIPIFVRAGSVIVRNTPGKNVSETFSNSETYEIYPTTDGKASGYWFDDDGITNASTSASHYELIYDSNKNEVLKKVV